MTVAAALCIQREEAMADSRITKFVITVIVVGFAVIVVGFAVTIAIALAQNSTLKLDNMALQDAPNLKPLEPDIPTTQMAPNPDNLSAQTNNPAMQTLKSLDAEPENPTAQTIPDPSAR